MAESRDLRDLFERDLRQIAVPPESEWFATTPKERAMPRWLMVTTAVAAIIAALVLGSYLYSRQPTKPATGPTGLYDVSGTVTDARTGIGVKDVRVYFAPVGGTCCTYLDPIFSALTDAAGHYRVPVGRGSYRVLFVAPLTGEQNLCLYSVPCAADRDPLSPVPYETLWWPSGVGMAQADYVVVDQSRDGIDAPLRVGHEIVGSFTFGGNPARAFIQVTRATQGDLVTLGFTNEDGTFRVAVPDGVYRVDFLAFDPGPFGGAWPSDIVVQGANVVGIDRGEP